MLSYSKAKDVPRDIVMNTRTVKIVHVGLDLYPYSEYTAALPQLENPSGYSKHRIALHCILNQPYWSAREMMSYQSTIGPGFLVASPQ